MMPKFYTPKIIAFLLCVAVMNITLAQNPSKPVAKFKPPVVKTYLGKVTGNGTIIPVEQGKELIGLPLTVVDAKNNSYNVTHYQFSYKRVGITEDETTGKTTAESDMVAKRFTTTPLDSIWIKTIQDELHSGEELYFFDIIAKDKDDRLFFAPELRLIIQ